MNRLFQIALLELLLLHAAAARADTFTQIEPLAAPQIIASTKAYAGGMYEAGNILDGLLMSEYAAANQGVGTHIDFDFGHPVLLGAFRHIDRRDHANVRSSQLIFSAEPEFRTPLATANVEHANQPSGVTTASFAPVRARYVRWQVTALGGMGYRTVGGAEIAFFAAGSVDARPVRDVLTVRPAEVILRENGRQVQPLEIAIDHRYAEAAAGSICIEGMEPIPVALRVGSQKVEIKLPAVQSATPFSAALKVGGEVVSRCEVARRPVRSWAIYLLPHSHVDIGYTAVQTDVERKQIANLTRAMELARDTAGYPEDARFKWNVEVMWPVENYLRQATGPQQQAFVDAVKSGQVGLEAIYGNLLMGLCRPEELMHMTDYGRTIAQRCGVPLQSAMISDVPGYTWSTVAALAEAGVKYFSFAPNYFDRMGYTMALWQDKPFYWETPDGRHKLLCWCPRMGYAMGHVIGGGSALARYMPGYLQELLDKNYPYDITYVRWNVNGDNGAPDEKLADVVKDWNATHVLPRLIIATTATAFAALERRYGEKLPVFRGDYTPFWEDGAASSARETALNRDSAERLVQAETLWTLRRPGPFPAEEFATAWRNVLLYSEHTWGAHNSIQAPDLPFVQEQWKIKQRFALDADLESRRLLARALSVAEPSPAQAATIEVYNTASWARTDLVVLPRELSLPGDRVEDATGKAVPSQRLTTGELAFLARDVPPLAARPFTLKPGPASTAGQARAAQATLSAPGLELRVDPHSGAIRSLRSQSLGVELVDAQAATALNDYFYLPGSKLQDLQRNGPVRIAVQEPGPLVASLAIEGDAPGCQRLRREVRLIDGLDRVELINVVDKQAIRAKEGVHFGFGFHVPAGTVRMDVGWAVIRPNEDQIPAACKNWFSVQRWLDVSNADYGVTWTTQDAPLVEVGAITANLVGSQTDPKAWMDHVPASQTIYSWVMNNHWHTNYRADQQGPTTFRYALRPHAAYDALQAARFGVERSQPLLAVARPAQTAAGVASASRLTIEPASVIVTALQPSDDGRAIMVRLFGAAGRAEQVSLRWANPAPSALWRSDLSQRPLQPLHGPIDVPAWGIVTLRAEL